MSLYKAFTAILLVLVASCCQVAASYWQEH